MNKYDYLKEGQKSLTPILDQKLPIDTPEWRRVEQLLTYLTEFAPGFKIVELTDAIGRFADDQSKRGYVLGQKELLDELADRAA